MSVYIMCVFHQFAVCSCAACSSAASAVRSTMQLALIGPHAEPDAHPDGLPHVCWPQG